jgi:hypothetical protein
MRERPPPTQQCYCLENWRGKCFRTPFEPILSMGNAKPSPSFADARNGINLSGSQVLVGWLSALCTVGLLLWAIIQLWLFEY